MKIVSITLVRSEIIYDVENCSFVEGDIFQTDNEHSRHQVFDIVQSGNIDRVNRILSLAIAECVEMLYPYTKQDISEEHEKFSNIETAPSEYVISLTLPDSFAVSTVELIKKLLHEYIVCKILADWLSITKPDSQANWEIKLKNIKQKVQTSLVSRTRTQRRKSGPFA